MAFESPLANPYRRSRHRRGAAFRSRGGRRTEFWSPAQLGLRAWYDAEVGQPKYGGPGAYVQLDGTSGDYIFTPDTATVSFSNDIEVVMRVKVTDWSAAAIQTLVGKYVTTGNQRSWKIASNTSAQIIITVSTDGTTTNTATITPSVALPDNTWIWLRLRMDLTNGSNSVGTVETAADTGTNDEPSSWTANGTATATALAGIFDSTAPLEIGSFQNGASERLAGQVARCIVRSGFGGRTIADFDARACYGPGYLNEGALPTAGNGARYVPLRGVSGDYVWTADRPSLRVTGDLEVVARVALADWTPTAEMVLVDKYITTGNQRGHRFVVATTGALRLYTSSDGSSGTLTATSTVALPATDGTAYWVKATLDVDNGASGNDAKFYWAADQANEPTSWTQLGSTVTTAGATSIYANTAPLEIGATAVGTGGVLAGNVYRAIVRNGIGGTVVADFNAEQATVFGQAADGYGNGWLIADPKHLGNWTLGLPKIYDRSGNGVAPAAFAAGSNQPRWLPWLGVSCVNLESAAAGTNSISCTAPSGAASYVARSRDYPNVVDATGVASAGAFAFTTAGQWQYISILNGSAVEIARFDASLCSQTGMTDSYSVAWTVNRGTAGRKTVVQSPVAASARSVILHGPDDYIDVPNAALPPLGVGGSASIAISCRLHATPTSFGRIFSTEDVTNAQFYIGHQTSGQAYTRMSDGTNSADINSGVSWAITNRSVAVVNIVGRSATGLAVSVNGGSPTTQDNSVVGDATSPDVGRIGARASSVGSHSDVSFEALVLRNAATSDVERDLLTAYYKGGL